MYIGYINLGLPKISTGFFLVSPCIFLTIDAHIFYSHIYRFSEALWIMKERFGLFHLFLSLSLVCICLKPKCPLRPSLDLTSSSRAALWTTLFQSYLPTPHSLNVCIAPLSSDCLLVAFSPCFLSGGHIFLADCPSSGSSSDHVGSAPRPTEPDPGRGLEIPVFHKLPRWSPWWSITWCHFSCVVNNSVDRMNCRFCVKCIV